MTKYGSQLAEHRPRARVTGVEISCSIVPRSHSRETVSEVSCAPTSARITATTPGMMKLRLSRPSLNQTRGSRSISPSRDGRTAHAPRPIGAANAALTCAIDALGIAHGDIGRVGVRGVEHGLHRGIAGGGEHAREIDRDDQCGDAGAAVHRVAHGPVAVQPCAPDREPAGGGETLDHIARLIWLFS